MAQGGSGLRRMVGLTYAVGRSKWELIPVLLIGGGAPVVLSDYYLYVLTGGLIIAIVLFGLTLIVGSLGELTLSQATFMGLGAFGAARLHAVYHFGLVENLIALTIICVPIAAVLAVPALHARASLLAITTLAIAVAADSYVFKQDNFLLGGGGSTSLAIPRPELLGREIASDSAFYLLVFVGVLGAAAVRRWLARGEFGDRLRAVRDSEVVAASRAVDVRWTRLSAFIVSSVFATVGGVLFAYHQQAVNAISFDVFHGATFAVLAVLSGGSTLGALAVAVLYALLPAMFRDVSVLSSEYVPALFGAAVIVALRYQAYRRRSRVQSVDITERQLDPVMVSGAPSSRPVQGSMVAGTLEIVGLSKRFGGVQALDDVSLVAGPEQGDIVGLIGPNGCGKTTLFNCVSGVITPEAGSVTLNGVDMTGWPAHWRARQGLARTFQGVKLFDSMSVRANLLVTARSVREQLPGESAEARVERAVELLDIGAVLQATPRTLPLGLRRRVDLAAALCASPSVLLLDEPASGMDALESAEFGRMLRRVANSGVRLLLVEHDMELMLGIATYLYVLDFGLLIAEGRPEEVRANQIVIDAYLGQLGTQLEVGV